MKYSPDEAYISILKKENAALITNFCCDDEELNEYLKQDALEYQRLHLGVTYVLFTKAANKPISYIRFCEEPSATTVAEICAKRI